MSSNTHLVPLDSLIARALLVHLIEDTLQISSEYIVPSFTAFKCFRV
ncbi:hypothetical protein HanRHA438_Chr15g0724241 [Helianthus annuus]|nr:hypothetical protein HanRHA438_Chr15g0724241 [Helianthus annuus]